KLLIFLIISGISATLIARMIQHRIEFYLNAVIIAIVHVAVIILNQIAVQPSGRLFIDISWGIANGFASSFIILLFLPLFEKIFSFVTDFTLLEFASLNRDIFKKLALEAPGTYHHSIVVGNLAEAGAVAVGANPILARVGAYYHDIGKLKKPEYFSENQLGAKNPHDQLTPEMSKLIISNHVKEGVEMAKRIGLPARVVRLIAEHHGSTVIEPFYLKALHTRGDSSIDDFRYPGPIPSSLEAAVIMLADSVEAAARSVDNITVSKLRKIIKEIFDKKFSDHQLDDCELTRKGLQQLQRAFFPILAGVFHPRVDYEDKSIRSRNQRK
ncbi:MAG TPA: HDIG domain-containing protein, partial [bacterium (Candidatus Stahlbacteria)]|nr:HDIG domain-containing protein [Candidatus Stahlbacteria bacterium]